ncbi:MAG: patatin-like phospholipase family protein [Alphaproteobacteria bacterium]|nr:patatin-like phospholipase family protein [Alphaproteobacteria bacterium]
MGVAAEPRDGSRQLLDVLTEELRQLRPDVSFDGSSFKALYRSIHGLERPRSALCLSGGGIRSASFALGVLQALAQHGLLFCFDYLSTVSGGGYIGSWLSAWRHHAANDACILKLLTTRNAAPPDEPSELQGLRASSNYLTPKLGATSADSWTAVALVVRNLLLNWAVFLPLFLAVVLVPIGCAEFIGWALTWPSYGRLLVLLAAAAFLVVGMAQSLANRSGADGQGINQGQFLRRVLFPLYLAATLLAAAAAVGLHIANYPPLAVEPGLGGRLWRGAVAGVVIYAISWWIAFFWRPNEFGRLALRGSADDPVPALQLLSYWVVAGAVAGAVVAFGYYLWLGIFAQHPDDPWVTNLLVAGGVSWIMLGLLSAKLLYIGLTSYAKDGDMEREWRARESGWLVAVTLIWLIFAGIVLFGAPALTAGWHWALVAAGGTVAGLVSVLMGSSATSAATTAARAVEKLSITQTISIATLIFLPLLAVLLAGGARSALGAIEVASHWEYLPGLRLLVTAIASAVLLVVALGASWYINVNRFSLHAVYRNRLIRGFLGPARVSARPPDGPRTPDRFTGFDPKDNVPMAALWPPQSQPHCLFPVLNMALNVVSTSNLAWQERKAESFVVTPLACGNPNVNFRSTKLYGDRKDGITLGTAMAISGASLSPNQGYNSSPLVSFVMMLANVRLGWWLGNPDNDKTAPREGPLFSFVPIINELFGLTNDRGNYVYLSDGGHFENLGIYEMVRRRCHYIVVSDADCDPKCQFEDLGNAVRKVWIDLGIAIRFRGIHVAARQPEPIGGVYCAIADIYYPERDAKPGLLVYIKPGYHGDEPADVRAYANLHPEFPHESTAEQWFTESQMESYRALGSHIVNLISSGRWAPDAAELGPQQLTLGAFFERAEAYLKGWPASNRAPTPRRSSPRARWV